MKSKIKTYTILFILTIGVILPVGKYYYSKIDKNDCMTQYIKFLDKDNSYNGFLYKFKDGTNHIVNASDKIEIQKMNEWKIKQVGIVKNGCINIYQNSLIDTINNTNYCAIVYLLNKI